MNWKKIHLYLYTFCRYFLATMIITYALAKIVGTQFVSQASVYDKPIGSLSGFQLTWFYYGYSYWYSTVIAVAQLASALLLFFRKTTRIGVIVFLSFMVNILLVDFAYRIDDAVGMAILLTLMALFVLLSDYKVFLKLLIQEPALFEDQEKTKWFSKIRLAKYVYIPVAFIGIFFLLTSLKNQYMKKDQFSGAWENLSTGDRLYFEDGNTFQLNKKCSPAVFEYGSYQFTNDSLTIQSWDTKAINNEMSATYTGHYQLKTNELVIRTADSTIRLKKIR